MTQVEFYIIETEKSKEAFRRAVPIIERAFKQNQRVFIHTNSQYDAEYMDELLWSHDPASFLPHLIATEADGIIPPIQIGFGQNPAVRPDYLINLSDEVPRFHGQFNRLTEFAHGSEDTRQKARDRYKYYKDRGYQLQHHKLDS